MPFPDAREVTGDGLELGARTSASDFATVDDSSGDATHNQRRAGRSNLGKHGDDASTRASDARREFGREVSLESLEGERTARRASTRWAVRSNINGNSRQLATTTRNLLRMLTDQNGSVRADIADGARRRRRRGPASNLDRRGRVPRSRRAGRRFRLTGHGALFSSSRDCARER